VLLSAAGDAYGQLPLSFELNAGQAAGQVQFLSRGEGYTLMLSPGVAQLRLQREMDAATGGSTTRDVVDMRLVGSSPQATVAGQAPLPGKVNYFLGTDPSHWRTDIPTFAKVAYQEVYPGIDLVYYGNQGQLEYDFVVKPGADPGRILMSYEGPTSMTLDAGGNLLLGTDGGQVVVQRPILYQEIGGARREVSGHFELQGAGDVGFAVGAYDRSRPLVIDPILAYSTYFGGTGDDQALAVAVDGQGAAYITGTTLSTDLATTAGAVAPGSFIADLFKSGDEGGSWQGSGNGLPDADFSEVVVDPKDSNTLYAATFRDRQAAQGVFKSVDGGRSWAPINAGLTSLNVTDLAIDPVNTDNLFASAEGFLFKSTDGGARWNPLTAGLPNDGVGYNGLAIAPSDPQVVYAVHGRYEVLRSTDGGASWAKVGPTYRLIEELVVDPADPNTLYYGITKGAFPDDPPGGVFKSTDGGRSFSATGLTASSGQFSLLNLVMDPADPRTLYAATTRALYKTTDGGVSWSTITPGLVTNGNIHQIAVAAGNPATIYVATNFQGVLKSTDGGGTYRSANLAVSFVSQVAVDPSDPDTVYATTNGRPRTNTGAIATDAFVAKLAPDGKSFAYITYLGGVGNDVGRGIGVDAQGNAIVGGITAAGSFPTTAGAFQATTGRAVGGTTGFVTKLNAGGSGLVYSTYLGGSTSNFASVGDEVRALVVDSQGRAVVTGATSSPNFPTTPNAYQPALFGFSANAFVTQLSADGSSLIYSTYLGGPNDNDGGEAIAVDAAGNFYVAGTTANNGGTGTPNTNFPTTGGAHQATKPVTPMGFFSKLDPTAGAGGLVYSTILGGSNPTFPRGIAVDAQGRAYVVGRTSGGTFPTTPSALQSGFNGDDSSNPLGDAFLSVFDPSRSGADSLVYSTYLGGSKSDVAYAVAIDAQGRAVVTGSTSSPQFPSKDALAAFPGGKAAFVLRLDIAQAGPNSLSEGTFLGGSNGQAEGRGLAVDAQGNVYVAGSTGAADFATIGPAQGAYRGGGDAFVARLSPAAGRADLRATISASPDPVVQGDTITYTITVTNDGPDAVDGVFVSDRLDAGTTFLSATPSPSSQGDGTLGFSLGPLASGASVQIRVTVRVDTPSFVTSNGTGQTLHTVVVSGDRPDPDTSDNQFVHTATVSQRTADLALTVTPEPGPILVGQPFVYRLVVANNGPDDALNVVLTENLPTAASFLSATPAPTTNVANVLTFDLGTIPAGTSRTVLLRMMPIGSVGSYVNNTASVTSPTLDGNAQNNTSSVQTVIASPDQADLGVSIAGPPFSVAFDGLTYTVTVANNGPHAANHVVFTGDVTALATIVSITSSQGTATRSGNVITADLGTIAPDSVATVTFVVNAPASDASITVKAAARADEDDPNPSDNKSTLRTKVGEGAITFVVTNTNDSGPGSLRQAMEDSEAQGSTVEVPNHIVFAIPESDPGLSSLTGAFVIQPLSSLPAIFAPTVIDGYTQPGSSPNTNPIDRAVNARIRIEIDGSQAGRPANGFTVYAYDTTIRGLAIHSFITRLQRGSTMNLLLDGAGIFVLTDRATIEGNFIGTDARGTVARGNETAGVYLFGSFNTVGGTAAAARNVISGNGAVGVGTASSNGRNLIVGNFIGTDISGAKALPTNLLDVAGLRLASTGLLPEGVADTIGGTTPAARNVISGNSGAGIAFLIPQGSSAGSSATRNLIIGNYIGTDLTGTKAVPNQGDGIFNDEGAFNTIGGTTPAERNLISGNRFYGVELHDAANVVMGNYIGTDVTGTKPLGNGLAGVRADGAGGTIGGTAAGAGNLISGNNGAGVLVTYDSYLIAGNRIGLDAEGNPLGNAGDGVLIQGLPNSGVGAERAQGNTVSGNTIAFNLGNGVAVTTTSSQFGRGTGNAIFGNSIYSNRLLGIDLGKDGVTPNHAPLVTADGPNHLQNTPVLTSATFDAGTTSIQGTISGLANRDYTIQFFVNTFDDPSGSGEGESYLGQVTARTDASGLAVFSAPFATQDIRGRYVTATATTPNPAVGAFGSDTSEFSEAVLITGAPPASPPDASADLAIGALVVTAAPRVGRELVYAFTVTNRGPDAAHTVVFTHTLPSGFQFVSSDATQGAVTLSGRLLTANLGTLAPGASQTVTITVTPTIAGPVDGSAGVDGSEPDPVEANNTATLATAVAEGSLDTDVSVTLEPLSGVVRVGDLILYKITITNNGPRVATGLSLSHALPDGAVFLPLESSGGFSATGATRRVSVGALAPGDSVGAFVAIRSTVAGDITNTSTITLDQSDSDPANNSASLVTHVLKAPSVTVLTATPNPSDPGGLVTFQTSVTSPAGGRPTGRVVLREGDTILDDRPLDEQGQASFGTSGLPPGTHTVTAFFSGDDNFDASSAPFTLTITGAPATSADLGLQIVASPGPVVVGSVLTYTITVRNNGPAAATNVTMIDDLPDGVAIGTPSSSRGSARRDGRRVTALIGTLASGETATVTIPVTPGSAATLGNTASVSAAESDPNTSNNSATVQSTVVAPDAPNADLSVAVVADPNPVAQGRNVAYTVVVRNAGPGNATGVTLTNTLPVGATFVSASSGTATDGVLTVPLGDLPAGASRTVTIIITATASGSLVNSAAVTAAGPVDLDTTNNAASASVMSNAPITLNKTIDLIFGSIASPGPFGYPTADAIALSALAPVGVIDAILAAPGLDPRLVAGLNALRGAAQANPSTLAFFSANSDRPQGVFAGGVRNPTDAAGASDLILGLYWEYLQTVTLGGGTLVVGPDTALDTLSIPSPNLTSAGSGQVRDGLLTVRLILRDAGIQGPIASSTRIDAAPNPSRPGQKVVLVATVSGNGRVRPGASPASTTTVHAAAESAGRVTFFDGDLPLGTVGLDEEGRAVLRTSALGPGRHTVTARYDGDDIFASSVSPAVVQLVGDLAGPRVIGFRREGFHRRPTTLVLTFDDALDPARAVDQANYRLLDGGRDGRFGTRDDRDIPVRGLSYDPILHAVTIRPTHLLSLKQRYRLTVSGAAPGGVSDEFGNLLDGQGTGQAGSDFVRIVRRHDLVITDRDRIPTVKAPARRLARRQGR
jgi:uncharacterized repeat protein (TIGR01451 family)